MRHNSLSTLAILLCFCLGMTNMVFAEEIVDNGENTRIDYLDKDGIRLRSLYAHRNLVAFYLNGDGTEIAYPTEGIVSLKFVQYGTESYPVKLSQKEGEVEETWIEFDSETRSAGGRMRKGEEKTVKNGTKFTLYARIPAQLYPTVDVYYDYTMYRDGEVIPSEYCPLRIPSYSPDSYIQSWFPVISPSLRKSLLQTLPENSNTWKRSETDPEVWSIELIAPNEPLSLTVGTKDADDKYLSDCIETALRVMYCQYIGGHQIYWNGDVAISNIIGDGFSGNYIGGYNIMMGDLMSYLKSSNNVVVTNPWQICMAEIDAANFLLDNLRIFTGASELALEDARGQLLCLRSYAYLRLLQLYAPRWEDSNRGESLCAPLKTWFSLEEPGLSSMNDVILQCNSDLEEAAKLLAGKSHINKSFFSSDVAKGLKMRIALLQCDWNLAYSLSKEILQNNTISSESEVRNGFFAPIESWLWGVSNTDTYGEQRLYYYSFQNRNACNGTYPSSWGYSPNAIDWDLYKRLPESDIRGLLYLFPEQDIMYSSEYIDPYKLYSKWYLPWCETDYIPEGVDWPAFYRYDYENPYRQLGVQIKFWQPGPDISASEAWFPMMRAEEILLSLAEAAYHCGDEAEAVAALEKLNANRAKGYTCTKTGEELLDEIRFYRDVELWGEGFAWFDYKRWNLPIKRNLWVEGDTTSGNWPAIFAAYVGQDEYNGWRMPLPAEAVKYNPLIDINALGYIDVTGYEDVSATNEKQSKLRVIKTGADKSNELVTEPEDLEEID